MEVFIVPDEVIRIASLGGLLLLLLISAAALMRYWSTVTLNITQWAHKGVFLVSVAYAASLISVGTLSIYKGSIRNPDLGAITVGYIAWIAGATIALASLTGRLKQAPKVLAWIHAVGAVLLLPFAWGYAGMGGESAMEDWLHQLPLFCTLNIGLPLAVVLISRSTDTQRSARLHCTDHTYKS